MSVYNLGFQAHPCGPGFRRTWLLLYPYAKVSIKHSNKLRYLCVLSAFFEKLCDTMLSHKGTQRSTMYATVICRHWSFDRGPLKNNPKMLVSKILAIS